MSKLSLDKFLALVERSDLIACDRLSQVTNEWKSRASLVELDDARYCADHLVEAGLLTDWQARKLLDGRHRGFFLGKYRLLNHLGSGGMSSVYLAEHVLMRRLVAVKILPQNRVSDSSYLARFHLEGQCAAALDHRNIVRAYDLDNEGKIHYLVMEYVEGRDLQAAVSHDSPLDFHVAADYIAQAAAGLEHAHDAGLVHRDIKPANLLVDRQGTVKILDMGLAKFTAAKGVGADLARDDHVLGTADYVAPEQTVNSSTVDHRADIYSLGCTLYFLLTGHPPFPSGTPAERMAAHQRCSPPSVLLDRPDAPEPLVAICRRMMEKSAEDRYQTAADVRAALAAWLASEAVAGRIRRRALATARHGGSGGGAMGDRSGSKINLITGSNPELGNSSTAEQRGSSPSADTDSNLHRATEKIPSSLAGAPGEAAHVTASQSHVLAPDIAPLAASGASSSGKTPLPPLIVSPPTPSPPNDIRPAPAAPFGTREAVDRASGLPIDSPILRGWARTWPPLSRPKSGPRWLWVFVLCGMILAAILLALSALPG